VPAQNADGTLVSSAARTGDLYPKPRQRVRTRRGRCRQCVWLSRHGHQCRAVSEELDDTMRQFFLAHAQNSVG